MKIVIQRVARASVDVAGERISEIGPGMLVLVGVEVGDTDADAEYLASKTAGLRIFDDSEGVMNLPVTAVEGAQLLAVSQFTLLASTRKGNRPSYIRAERGEAAKALYDLYCQKVADKTGLPVKQGVFGADMQVALVNSGPVTIIIDSANK